ncbi:MAG: hypothetical protein ACU837_15565 [Gammaproteobacteria bacterium]
MKVQILIAVSILASGLLSACDQADRNTAGGADTAITTPAPSSVAVQSPAEAAKPAIVTANPKDMKNPDAEDSLDEDVEILDEVAEDENPGEDLIEEEMEEDDANAVIGEEAVPIDEEVPVDEEVAPDEIPALQGQTR